TYRSEQSSFAYVANSVSNTISAFTINQDDGRLAFISNIGAGAGPLGIAVHPTRAFLYVANWYSGSVSLYTINQTTGALARNGPDVSVGTNPIRAVVHPSGRYLYVTNNGSHDVSVFTINQTDGTLSRLTGSPFASGTNPVGIGIDA